MFVGFTDNIALEAPVISAASANTVTTNATDAVGFMFDTRMSTVNWWLTGVANDVDATMQNSTFAPVANTFETLRVEVTPAGKASFFRNGKPVGTLMAGALTPATLLTPCLYAGKLSTATTMTVDYDYVYAAMNR